MNFSNNHSTYYTAYRYNTIQDKDAVHSRDHPDLLNAVLQTEQVMTSQKKVAKQKVKGKRKRRAKHLSIDVGTLHWRSQTSANQFNYGKNAHQPHQDQKSQKTNNFCRWITSGIELIPSLLARVCQCNKSLRKRQSDTTPGMLRRKSMQRYHQKCRWITC